MHTPERIEKVVQFMLQNKNRCTRSEFFGHKEQDYLIITENLDIEVPFSRKSSKRSPNQK